MKIDKLKVYALELILIAILFFALFASNIFTRSVIAIIMALYAVLVVWCLKKRKISSVYKKQVTFLMIVFTGIYLGIFYLLGLYFGFMKSKVVLSLWSIGRFIIPLSVIIISSEMIRKVFLSQNITWTFRKLKINISLILTYISMVLVDLLIYTEVYDLSNLEDFLTAIGFVLFASLSCNLLYNYICARYGSKEIIFYRLITTLYMYIIPVVPDVYIFFRSFLRMVYPYIMYMVIEKFYSQNDFAVSYVQKKNSLIGNAVLFVVITLLIMLISCQFRYGILVIGSHSMTGTLNIGDAVIFEAYDDQKINEGQVIIFNYNGLETIHRVVEKRNVNGEIRYYTKGDANKRRDENYITNKDIIGVVELRVKYIGKPTLWVRSLFSDK